MALAVNQVAGKGDNSSSSVTITAITTVSGSLLVVIGHAFNMGGNDFVNGDVTDSKSNTYAIAAGTKTGVGGLFTMAMWVNDGGTRGSSHTISLHATGAAATSIGVIEITGHNAGAAFDATTVNVGGDVTSPYQVTAGGSISGNQIAVMGVTPGDTGAAGSWTDPTGYTTIFGRDGQLGVACYSGYKINETGTPGPSAAFTAGDNSFGVESFATFKEAAGGGGGQDPDVPILRPVFQNLPSKIRRWWTVGSAYMYQRRPEVAPLLLYGQSLDGNITPTGSVQADYQPAGGHFITGSLSTLFVPGSVFIPQYEIQHPYNTRRRQLHAAYTYQKKNFWLFLYDPGVLSGSITPTGNLQNQTNKVLAGGITPTGALQTDFISGLQDTQQRVRYQRVVYRPHLHQAFNTQKKVFTPPYAVELAGSITPTGNLQNQTNKALTAGITPAGALQTDFVSGLQDTQQRVRYQYEVQRPHLHAAYSYQRKPFTQTANFQYSQGVDGNITPTGNLIKQTNKALTAGITPTGALQNQTNKLLAGGITPTGALSADFVSGIQDVQAKLRANYLSVARPHLHSAYVSQRKYWFATGQLNFLSLSGQIDTSGALTKQTNKVTSGGITPTGEVDQSSIEPLSGSITPGAIINKQTNKGLAGAITPTGALAADFVWGVQDTQERVRWMAEQVWRPHLHAAFSYQRKPSMPQVSSYAQPVTGQIDTSGNLIKQTNKTLTAGIDNTQITGNLAADPVYQLNKGQDRREQQWQAALRKPPQQLWAQHKVYSALPNVYQISLGGTITPAGNLIKQINKLAAGGLTPVGQLTKQTNYLLGGGSTPTGAITKQTGKYETGALLPVGNATRLVAHALSGLCTTSGAPTKKTFKNLAGVLTESGNLVVLLISSSDIVILDPLEGRLDSSGRLIGKLDVSLLEGSLQGNGQTTSLIPVKWLEGNLDESGAMSGN